MSSSHRRSFRDPSGSLHEAGSRVFRVLSAETAGAFQRLIEHPSVSRLVASGALVGTRVLEGAERADAQRLIGTPADALIVEHPRIETPSYPYEWSAEMLHAAGSLTLDIADALLGEGLGLKDATPYNVLFIGTRPVFVDVASIEERSPADETWRPYAQFMRTFVLPLLAHRRFGVSLGQIFLAHRDGLEPEQVYAMASWGQRLSPALIGSVSLPSWLGARAGAAPPPAPAAPRPGGDPERARFILGSLLRRLRRQLDAAVPGARRSAWSDYLSTSSYTDADFTKKEAFVKEQLGLSRPRTVLDVGCNTGHFSALAADSGASVVALDYDAVSVGHTWRRADAGAPRAILPLVANLARPSPGLGWRYNEQSPLLERLVGRFDLVLMLAVLHHLVVTERVPLADVLDLAADLSRDRVLIEYVPPSDIMFRTIARGRDELHAHFTAEYFEAACAARFEIVTGAPLDSGRRLYLLKKRTT